MCGKRIGPLSTSGDGRSKRCFARGFFAKLGLKPTNFKINYTRSTKAIVDYVCYTNKLQPFNRIESVLPCLMMFDCKSPLISDV